MSESNKVIQHLLDIKKGMEKDPERVEEFVIGGKHFRNRQPHMRLGDRVRFKESK
jgi:hypothetical protein